MPIDNDDELLELIDDLAETSSQVPTRRWRLLIVDDDVAVHQATTFALVGTRILGRELEFLHAYSAAEAATILLHETHIAVVLLDVVMERPDAGLDLVRIIRQEMQNAEVRIILRTGQPGYAPEIEVIRDFDINDYKIKTELTGASLYSVLTTAIRSYEQIHALNMSRDGLDMIIQASGALLLHRGVCDFAAGVITQISALMGIEP